MKKNKTNIPEFKTKEEEAKFWENHSFAEFKDELKQVRVHFSKKLSDLT